VNNKKTLSNKVVFSILPDPDFPDQFIWAGTNGGGLNKINLLTGEAICYTMQQGLPNDVVYGILYDDRGHLWLSTNMGLSRFKIKDGTFRNFDVRDGLQGNEFNRNAFCKDKKGYLYFGGINGFNMFNPENINDNKVLPTIVITGIKIKNHAVSFRDRNSPVKLPPYLADKLTLDYHDNMVTFEFAALEFTSPMKNHYRYKLDGFDKEWIESDNNPSAIYTNLDPGDYTFRVMGSNNAGLWSVAQATIQLTILPPWYMTFWFRALVVAAIAGGIYSLSRYRFRQALKLQQLRNRIASDLHDEIGSTLSSIALYGEATKKMVRDNQDAIRMLNRINDNTNYMMEAMSDIVWSINARGDKFDEVISKMRSFAAEVTETRGCSLHFNESTGLSHLELDMIQRKNIYLIFKEAVNNAIKYSSGKNLTINLSPWKSGIYMRIEDDGVGFDPATVKRGNGLNNMNQRAVDLGGTLNIKSAPGSGTLLELHVRL
jgi:signal transduction histidine kinase